MIQIICKMCTDIKTDDLYLPWWIISERETIVSDIFIQHVKAAFVSIAVDARRRAIYWTNSASDLIERVNLDGSNRTVIAEHDMGSPIDVEVDSHAGYGRGIVVQSI